MGKCGRCVGLTTLSPSSADCLEIWEPQTLGKLRACLGIVLHTVSNHNVTTSFKVHTVLYFSHTTSANNEAATDHGS